MKPVTRYRFLSRFLFISLIFLACSLRAFSQRSNETQGAALKREMYEMETKAFSNYDVQQEAQRRMDELINRAVATYEEKPSQEAHNRIIENFRKILGTTVSLQQVYMKQHGPSVIMTTRLFLKNGVITLQSIEKALKKLCPLWPFC